MVTVPEGTPEQTLPSFTHSVSIFPHHLYFFSLFLPFPGLPPLPPLPPPPALLFQFSNFRSIIIFFNTIETN